MRSILRIFALLCTVLSVLTVLSLYLGLLASRFGGATSDIVVGLQMFTLMAAALAMSFGFVGWSMDRRLSDPARKSTSLSLTIGLLSALLALAIPLLFR